MTPEYVNGTSGPTEIVAAEDAFRRMSEMLSDPNVDRVAVRRVDGQAAAAAAKAKAKRRQANKNARRERRR